MDTKKWSFWFGWIVDFKNIICNIIIDIFRYYFKYEYNWFIKAFGWNIFFSKIEVHLLTILVVIFLTFLLTFKSVTYL
jgi:hypothetical protein